MEPSFSVGVLLYLFVTSQAIMLYAGSPDGTTSVAAGVSAEAAAAGQVTATTDDYTWLRGTQQTDEDGMVEFETIVPGWYAGRTAHIHLKVSSLMCTAILTRVFHLLISVQAQQIYAASCSKFLL